MNITHRKDTFYYSNQIYSQHEEMHRSKELGYFCDKMQISYHINEVKIKLYNKQMVGVICTMHCCENKNLRLLPNALRAKLCSN